MDVIFLAISPSSPGSSSNVVTHYSSLSNIQFTNGGTAAITTWIPVKMGSINITGLPAEVATLNGGFRSILDASTEFGTSTLGTTFSGAPTGGAFSQDFLWHTAGDRTVGRVTFLRTGSFQSMTLLDSFPTSTLTQTLAGPALTPWLQSTNTIASLELKAANWLSVANTSSVLDGQVLRVSWLHSIAAMNHPSQWHFIMPPGQTSIVFPALPTQFIDNMPMAQDLLSPIPIIRLFDISTAADYDMVRKLPSSNIMCLECAVRAGELQRVVFTPLNL
jgi:hypothetical protein